MIAKSQRARREEEKEEATERESRRLELYDAFISFLCMLNPPSTLDERAEAWRAVDIARMRHELMIPGCE